MTAEERFADFRGLAHYIAATYTRRINRMGIGEDIHQEALLGLWKACLGCSNDDTFKGYASRRINGEIQDFLRRQDTTREAARRERLTGEKRPQIVTLIEARDLATMHLSPEALAMHSEFAHKLHAAIAGAQLSPRERQVVGLLYDSCLTQEETADRLHITAGRVAHLKKQAMEKIREVALAA